MASNFHFNPPPPERREVVEILLKGEGKEELSCEGEGAKAPPARKNCLSKKGK